MYTTRLKLAIYAILVGFNIGIISLLTVNQYSSLTENSPDDIYTQIKVLEEPISIEDGRIRVKVNTKFNETLTCTAISSKTSNSRLLKIGASYSAKIKVDQRYCKIIFLSKAIVVKKSKTEKIRKQINNFFENNFQESESLAVIRSMLLGDLKTLTAQTEQVFKELGLFHMLVVSGYHVGIIYLFISLILGKFLAIFKYYGRNSQLAVKLISIYIACFYIELTGMQPAAIRAGISFAIFLIVQLIEKGQGFFRNILLTFFIVNIYSPLSFLDLGSQLTFAALLGLSFLELPFYSRYFAKKSNFRAYFAIWIFTSAILCLHLGEGSFLGLLSSILFMPSYTIIVFYLVLPSMFLALIWKTLAVKLLSVLIYLLDLILMLSHLFSEITYQLNISFENKLLTGTLLCLFSATLLAKKFKCYLLDRGLL